jgi:site-specific DNA-methyltransferase (adenine-specific)
MIEPVVIGDATLYLGDCLEILPTLAAGSVDAVVTDPPYGIDWDCDYTKISNGVARHHTYDGIIGDKKPFDPTFLLGYPTVALFGFNCFSDRLPLGSVLIWLKKNGNKLGTVLADCELVWLNRGHGVFMLHYVWDGFMREGEKDTERQHPTQKPIRVMKWVMERANAQEGQTILDPFMGSGTTGVACAQLGRKFIGIEISERYFEIAVKRIEAAQAQLRLDL